MDFFNQFIACFQIFIALICVQFFPSALQAKPPSVTFLQVQMKVFEKNGNYYDPSLERTCKAVIRFEYPIFIAGADPQFLSILNQNVQEFLLKRVTSLYKDSEKKPNSLRELAQRFMVECKEFGCEYEGAECIRERKVIVGLNQPEAVSLDKYADDRFPLQHGTSDQSHFVSFNPKTGKRYELSDFFDPRVADKLNQIGKETYSELVGNGDWLPDNFLEYFSRLPESFMLSAHGLKFVLNAYDEKPGPGKIVFEIPYSKMRGLILSNGIVAALTKRNEIK